MTYEYQLSGITEIAKIILKDSNTKIFFLKGDLGAGKTTLVKELVNQLGGNKEEVSSPTYSIVNEYDTKYGVVYHFDLYRLKNLNEVLDIGFEEYIFSNNYCFIEWPEIIEDWFEENKILLEIETTLEKRKIKISFL